MSTTTRTTLSREAREVLGDLGIRILDLPAPGGYVALGDDHAGPYEGRFLISAVEEACEAVADASEYEDDEYRTATAYRFEAFHDALDRLNR